MGYVSPITSIANYQIGTDLLIDSDTETETSSSSYVLAKTLEIALRIFPQSNFVIYFEIKATSSGPADSAQAYLDHNGSAIGSVQQTGSTTYQVKQQDIKGETWQIGDTINLWIKANYGVDCRVRNFRAYGIYSPFIITKESV